MKLDVLIRADASTLIGSGHVARTCALAERLRAAGVRVGFVCRPLAGNRIDELRSKAFPVLELAPGRTDNCSWLGVTISEELLSMRSLIEQLEVIPTWIIVDHYALDERWEAAMAGYGPRMFVIDDLADRTHRCAGLLDQNYHSEPGQRYAGKVPKGTKLFLGPGFALIREEFFQYRRRPRIRDGAIKRILVLFGGYDLAGYASDAVRALLAAQIDADVDIIAPTQGATAYSAITFARENPRFRVQGRTENIAELMIDADLAIGAAGVTTLERCFVGLPAIVYAVAQNQEPALRALERDDIVMSLGVWHERQPGRLTCAVRELMHDPARVRAYGQRAYEICGQPEARAAELLAFLKEPIQCLK